MATTIIGIAATNGKVHMAWGGNEQTLCSTRRRPVVLLKQLGELAEGGGQDSAIAALQAANVAPRKLCGNCFYPLFRMAYASKTSQ